MINIKKKSNLKILFLIIILVVIFQSIDIDAAGRDRGKGCLDNDNDYFDTCENDCDDNNAAINPRAEEICDDSLDNDCDEKIDSYDEDCDLENECPNVDHDLFSTCQGDCNDNNYAINPGAQEICDDNLDNDCDEKVDLDDEDCVEKPLLSYVCADNDGVIFASQNPCIVGSKYRLKCEKNINLEWHWGKCDETRCKPYLFKSCTSAWGLGNREICSETYFTDCGFYSSCEKTVEFDGSIEIIDRETCLSCDSIGECRGKASYCDENYNLVPVEPEKCDNLDNDCDGEIDNSLRVECSLGTNLKSGYRFCNAGVWSACKQSAYLNYVYDTVIKELIEEVANSAINSEDATKIFGDSYGELFVKANNGDFDYEDYKYNFLNG